MYNTKMTQALMVLLVLIIIIGLSVPAVAQQGSWFEEAPMPTARAYAAGGAINGLFYVAGGEPPTGYSTTVLEAYDPISDTWSQKQSMPSGRSGAGSGVIGTKLYVVGGSDGFTGDTNTLQVYDAIANSWTFKTSIPVPSGIDGVMAGVINGILYIVGGEIPNCHSVNTLWAYDPVADAWVSKAPMPTPRDYGAAGVVNGKLYVMGGSRSSFCGDPQAQGVLDSVEVYDPASDTWAAVAPLPTPRSTLSAAVINGTLYVMGGNSATQLDASVLAYNTTTNTWSNAAPIPTPRQVMAVGAINNVAYTAGGLANGAMVVGTVESFTPTITVAIDIKPGSSDNTINLGSAGVVPVAILSNSTFDATQVDPATVSLAGATVKLIGKGDKYACSAQDVNYDGILDFLCNVQTAQFMIQTGDSTAVLEAKTYGGLNIRGEDSIKIVP